MSFVPVGTYDVAVIGTGLATLVAAHELSLKGKSVLVLNPSLDFFLEDSELPLDPFWPVSPDKDSASVNLKRTPGRLKRSSPETLMDVLSPAFPGALEAWPLKDAQGFYDPSAPHIRTRSRVWVSQNERDRDYPWELMDELFVEASDAGLNPQILEGMQATSKFPGISKPMDHCKGLLIPRVCDVDVVRYRNGLLEFLRERFPLESLLSDVSQVELQSGGVKYYLKGQTRNAQIREGVIIFWTPQLSNWIMAQARKKEVQLNLPTGVRLWEQWSLLSRDALDLNVVGVFRNMAVWAEAEGSESLNRLAVLRAAELVPMTELYAEHTGMSLGSKAAWGALSELCHNFMKWDRFSVRSMRVRGILEWDQKKVSAISLGDDQKAIVIPGADGPISEVVRTARNFCQSFLENRE